MLMLIAPSPPPPVLTMDILCIVIKKYSKSEAQRHVRTTDF
jgi:hypothetical protein